MGNSLDACLHVFDQCAVALILPLAIWILLNGLDDLVPLVLWLRTSAARKNEPPRAATSVEKRIAIFVPLWLEHRVIGRMLERNLSAIRYSNYDFFVGAYPNDRPTIDVVSAMAERHSHVHLALCPHDGPTSKADCLNWIYQRMLLYEEEQAIRFDVVVTHDAEDVIHADALATVNLWSETHDMVQIPVIPLATHFREFTHGLYCDDFAESQTKDMIARQAFGSFIPSCGVGTGFTRSALERIAAAESNRIFEPACLTEDYENGYRLSLLGCRQRYVPLRHAGDSWMATRAYFPRTASSAIRQRTRWITGIALQTWERHGWSGGLQHIYWLWRDRKGLIGGPASLLANLLSLYGLATLLWASITARPWGLAAEFQTGVTPYILACTLAFQLVSLSARMFCSARIYGLSFGLAAPLRAVWGNWINGRAAVAAVSDYLLSRIQSQPLRWVKTEHSYPSRAALIETHRLLGQILVGSGYITAEQLDYALAAKGITRLGEFLIAQGVLEGEDLCEALALQHNLPYGRIDPASVAGHVVRSLPADVITEWKVLPFRVFSGDLFLASPELPSEELYRELRKFTRLEVHLHLVTEKNFAELREQWAIAAKRETGLPPSTSFHSARA